MAKKTLAQKICKVNQKIAKWTVRCEVALTRADAIKALRKIAKHTDKLAELQGQLYTYRSTEDFL